MRRIDQCVRITAARLAGPAALLALLALAVPAGDVAAKSRSTDASSRERDARAGEDFNYSWQVASGHSIEVKGVNGSIHATATDGDSVEVSATKHAHKSDPASVRIEWFEHDGSITVCALYPASDGRPNECEAGDKGRMNAHDNDVVVDFEVRVPSGVRFIARTVNGSIGAEDLAGPVEARTVNGAVDLSTDDLAEATTVNGSIHVRIGRSSWDDTLQLSTVNGGISLTLPPELDARLEASTVNGEISSDFPVKMQGRMSARKLSGTVGKGGPGELALSTVNGDIRFKSAQ